MILVYLKSGDCIEIEGAIKAERQGESLVCYGSAGETVATFAAIDVDAFTANPEIAEIILDEACEDLTVVPSE